ncbi:nuclear transport factor 2 family protein [Enemella sp. A6]|uniref:nuclear transport factor 2 family protein n=1 Tax=Enemella sp. A6 TaxID=3440152 RepID=UPI003EB79594
MTIEERLAALETEVRHLRDIAEITNLAMSYGPLVDSGAPDAVADLYIADGVYDVDEICMNNREEIRAMVKSEGHQGWITGGAAHFTGPLTIEVDGDTATAVGHTLMVIKDEGEFRFYPRRATASVWEFVRTDEGWKISRRTNRLLDGREESRALFADALGATRYVPGA